MSDLADLVDPLKREIAVPGMFATTFPNTTDQDLADTLLDAFWEAKLDTFFPPYEADDVGIVTPDLPRPGGALVVIYAAVRIIRNELRNRATHFRAESSGQLYERDQGATLLKALLDALEARKLRIYELLVLRPAQATPVATLDALVIRELGLYDWNLVGNTPLNLFGEIGLWGGASPLVAP